MSEIAARLGEVRGLPGLDRAAALPQALAEIYTMHSFALLSNLNFLLKIAEFFADFLKQYFADLPEFFAEFLRNFDQIFSEFFQNAATFRSFPKPSEAFWRESGIGTSSGGRCMRPDAQPF